MNSNFKLIEALMYIQGESGLTPSGLKDVTSMPLPNARRILKEFLKWFNNQDRGIMVVEFNDHFKLATKIEFKNDISKLVSIEKNRRLSQAAIEVAGIIAYKSPITKTQINQVRGVSSEAVVNTLLVKGLIEEKGVAQSPGLPVLYGLSPKFFDYFNIGSIKELPNISEFDESEGIDDEFELFSSQRED